MKIIVNILICSLFIIALPLSTANADETHTEDKKFEGYYSVLDAGLSRIDVMRFKNTELSSKEGNGNFAPFIGLKLGKRWQTHSFQYGFYGQVSKTYSDVTYMDLTYNPDREIDFGISLGYIFGSNKNMQIFFEGPISLSFVNNNNEFYPRGHISLGFEHLIGSNLGYRISMGGVFHENNNKSTQFQDTRISIGAVYRF